MTVLKQNRYSASKAYDYDPATVALNRNYASDGGRFVRAQQASKQDASSVPEDRCGRSGVPARTREKELQLYNQGQ